MTKKEKVAEFEGYIDFEQLLWFRQDTILFDDRDRHHIITFQPRTITSRFPLGTKVKIIIETIGDQK